MASRQEFTPRFHPDALRHPKGIERKYHSLIERRIEEQRNHEPELETRKRKRLHRPSPFEAGWELRCGPQNRFRVYYPVNHEDGIVEILAIGVKIRSLITFAGEEYKP
jgi:mRNA-degrading endonuclease RelE of RelBE toxin-antitoxin system